MVVAGFHRFYINILFLYMSIIRRPKFNYQTSRKIRKRLVFTSVGNNYLPIALLPCFNAMGCVEREVKHRPFCNLLAIQQGK